MARRTASHVALIAALLISLCWGRTGAQDWMSDLTRSLNRMSHDINEQVDHLTRQLHTQIRQNVESSVGPALRQVHRAIENLPRDASGRIITNNDNSVIINTGNGLSRSIVSGHTSDGEPFVRDITERYEGNILNHNETYFNPKTNTTERIRWKLDLSNPNSQPEILSPDE